MRNQETDFWAIGFSAPAAAVNSAVAKDKAGQSSSSSPSWPPLSVNGEVRFGSSSVRAVRPSDRDRPTNPLHPAHRLSARQRRRRQQSEQSRTRSGRGRGESRGRSGRESLDWKKKRRPPPPPWLVVTGRAGGLSLTVASRSPQMPRQFWSRRKAL